MLVDLGRGTPEEKRALEHLRTLKAECGSGTLRVEVNFGRESLFKREHSEKVSEKK